MKKAIRNLSLALALVIGFLSLPVSAAEPSDLSKWARLEVLDAARYGIYTSQLHKDGYKVALTADGAKSMLDGLERKFEAFNQENPEFKALEVEDYTSREGFLRGIYNVVGRYDLNSKADPIEYLRALGVVNGNGKSLALDRKVTVEEAILFSKRSVDKLYAMKDQASKGLLWEAEKNGNKVYMLGSIHMADSSIYPFSNRIMDRFKESDKLFVEVDISDQEANAAIMAKKMEEMGQKMKYSDGKTLKDDLGEELYGKLKKVMDKFEVEESIYKDTQIWGVIPQIETFKMLNSSEISEVEEPEISEEEIEELMKGLEEAQADDPSKYGIDMYLLLRAKEMGKPIGELESMEFQMNMLFDTLFKNPYMELPAEEQKKLLNNALDEVLNPSDKVEEASKTDIESLGKDFENSLKDFQDQLKTMLEAWKEADADKLKTIMLTADNQEISSSILGDRDKLMAEKIGKLLDSDEKGTYFVVVGAAHYVMDGMTIDNLRNAGYKVKSLNIN